MGIQTSAGGPGAVFYKINQKEGCFQQGSGANKKQYEPGRTALTGVLKGFKIDENEYEGVKSEEIRLIFSDVEEGAPNMHVSMTIASDGAPSAFAMRTLAKIVAAHVGQPITLTPYLLPKGSPIGDTGSVYEGDVTGVSVKQGGQKLSEDLGTPDNKLPDRPPMLGANNKPIVIKGRELKDSSAWVPILDGLLDRLHKSLQPTDAQSHSDDDGINPADVAAAAAAAPGREAMRARA